LQARGEEGEGREGREGGEGGEGESDTKSDILALTVEEVIAGADLELDAEAAHDAEADQTLALGPAFQNTNPATNNVGGTAAAAALSETNGQTSEGEDPANITISHEGDGQAAKGLDSKDTMSGDGGTGRAGRKYEYEYEGEWQHGLRHGEGRLLYPTGETYVGDWIKNVRHGVGLVNAVGFTYEVNLLRIPCEKVRSMLVGLFIVLVGLFQLIEDTMRTRPQYSNAVMDTVRNHIYPSIVPRNKGDEVLLEQNF